MAIDVVCAVRRIARSGVQEELGARSLLDLVDFVTQVFDPVFAAGQRWEHFQLANSSRNIQ
jgi:hypothetical protein